MCCNMNDPIISVCNLTKSYKLYFRHSDRLREVIYPWKKRHTLFHALRDVSFDVYKGEHLGIIGVNGSGKSTLLQLITGVLAPSSGSFEAKGRVAALLELGAGFNPELTGRENVSFLTSILGVSSANIDSFFEDIIEFAELGEFIDQPVKIYSSGMFARLAFAMNIASIPDILIVDEALAVGDAFFQQKCIRRMKAYREQGTILFVSHDVGSVIDLCENVLWLEEGRVRKYGPAKEVCEHYMASNYTSNFASKKSIIESVKNEKLDLVTFSADEFPDSIDPIMEKNLAELTVTKHSDFAGKESFGDGGATILRCTVENKTTGSSLFTCDDLCRLTVYFHCRQDIICAVVGFMLKDRLGNPVYGTNSFRYHTTNWNCKEGELYAAVFEFTFPDLISAEYLLTLAVSEGTLNTHRQHHWIYDAMSIHFLSMANDGTFLATKCSQCFLVGEPYVE